MKNVIILVKKFATSQKVFLLNPANKYIAKLSQAKPQLQLSWLALASLNFT